MSLNDTSIETPDILAERSTIEVVSESCVSTIIIFIAFIGNVMICVAVWRNPNLRTACNYFIVSIAVSGIVLSVVPYPLIVAFAITGKMIFPEWVCQVQAYCLMAFGTLSVTTMTQTAIHRYVKVVHPHRSPRKKTVLAIIIGTWIFMFLLSSLYFLVGKRAVFYPKPVYCFIKMKIIPKYIAVTTFIGQLLNIVFITFCYGKVFATVRKHNQNTKMSLQSRSRNQSRFSPEESLITKVLFSVVIGVIFFWTPVYCIWMLDRYQIILPRGVHLFASASAMLSSCINPVIYGVLNREFKAEFEKMLRNCYRFTRCRDTNNVDPA